MLRNREELKALLAGGQRRKVLGVAAAHDLVLAGDTLGLGGAGSGG